MVNFFSIARFFLFMTPFILVVVTTGTLFPYIVGKYFFFRFLTGLTFITFLAGVILDRQRAEEYWSRFLTMIKSPLGIAIGVFTFIFVLSGFFGVDPSFSFWSNFERGEGGLQIIFLYIFFLMLTTLLKDEKDWRKYFALMVIAAFFVVFYGIGGALKHVDMEDGGILSEIFSKFMGTPFGEISRFQGSLGNPAYLATYLLFAMFFAFYLLLSQRKAKSDNLEHNRKDSAKKTKRLSLRFFNMSRNKVIALVFFIAFFAFFFFWAATRGAFLGLIAGGIVGAVYLFIVGKKWRVPIIAIVLLGAVLLGGAYMYQDHPVIKESRIARLFDISFDTETFRHRAIMWGMAVDGWKERPLFGWGAENYHHIFYRHSDPDYYEFEEKGVGNYGAWFDRAHSTTFDYLSQSGILGLLSYWAMFAVFFWLFFKAKLHRRESVFLATLMLIVPVAYLVQGQVLFEVLAIYFPFYVFMSFAAFKLAENGEPKHLSEKMKRLGGKIKKIITFGDSGAERMKRNILAGTLIVVTGVFVCLGAFAPLMKAQAYVSAVRAMQAGEHSTVEAMTEDFDTVFDLYSPIGQREITRFYAQNVINLLKSQGQELPEDVLLHFVNHAEEKTFEDDPIQYLHMAYIYDLMLQLFKKKTYFEKAEYYYDKVLEIGPKLPQALEGKARLYSMVEGYDEEFQEVAERVLEIWPSHPYFQTEGE